MILSRRTKEEEVTVLSEELVTDLTACFRLIRDDVLTIIDTATREKWADTRIQDEIRKLFSEVPDEQPLQ